MLAFHMARGADVTVAAVPVPRSDARAFGTLEVDATGRVLAFHEKVAEPPALPDRPDAALASMGNYIFTTPLLVERLIEDAARDDSVHDFGRDILPMMVARGDQVYAYDFETNEIPGEPARSHYWRDIGTIDAYFAAQLDLVDVEPEFNLYNRRWPIRTGINHDPPAKFVFRDEDGARTGVATDSIVSQGCIISGGNIHRSVLGHRCRVNSFSEIEECVLLENVTIGRHAKIRRSIIDKDIEIPPGTEIGYDLEQDRKRFYVSEGGVVVIPKRTKLET
jgi:glucose-1-phosphate adenylyltransferase